MGIIRDLAWFLRKRPRRVRQLAVTALVIIALIPATIETVHRYDFYFTRYPQDGAVTWGFHHGILDAIAFAERIQGDYDVVWIADANQPYIFLLFEAHVDPSAVQGKLVDTDGSPVVWQVDAWGKYRFGKNYQGPPDSVPVDSLPILYQSPHTASQIFYEVRGGTTPDGQRILVVDSPNR